MPDDDLKAIDAKLTAIIALLTGKSYLASVPQASSRFSAKGDCPRWRSLRFSISPSGLSK
jgi:hypothetical protein